MRNLYDITINKQLENMIGRSIVMPYLSYWQPSTIMNKILLLILTLILITSCDSKHTSSELEKLTKKLTEKENRISELQTRI
jgi:ERCC4-type nuclease